MTQEVSNKTLALLLVGAIVVSLFGTFVSLNRLNRLSPGLGDVTGFATSGSGTVQLNVSGQASFRVYAATVDFGEIQPNVSGFWIRTQSNNTWANGTGLANNCESATSLCAGIEIENDGNELINISFNTSSDADSFIGGTSPSWSFKLLDGNRSGPGNMDGCDGSIPFATWTEVTAATDFRLCNSTSGANGFNFTEGADRITLEFNLTIPNDPVVGQKVATIELFIP